MQIISCIEKLAEEILFNFIIFGEERPGRKTTRGDYVHGNSMCKVSFSPFRWRIVGTICISVNVLSLFNVQQPNKKVL